MPSSAAGPCRGEGVIRCYLEELLHSGVGCGPPGVPTPPRARESPLLVLGMLMGGHTL